MNIRFGHQELLYPGPEMGELRDSDPLIGDPAALKARMHEDGFLYLSGFLPREAVLQARQTIFAHMEAQQALVPETPIFDGVMPAGGKSVPMMGRKGIAHHPDVLRVVEAPELFSFFESYFGEPATTYNYKWLRAVGNEEYTGAHYDFVYMGRGSTRLHTCWIPLGDIPTNQGTLAMCAASNRLERFSPIRDTYGRMDVDRDLVEGWFSKEPLEIVEKFGGSWETTNFQAGDIMIFGMHTMHASTTNLTNMFRLSCDVRFQPVSDPVDERWRKNGEGHTAAFKEVKPMNKARQEWGI